MKLSTHFSLAELIRSDTAKRKRIKNFPSPIQTENLILLCNKILEPIREHFKVPIFISSGFRSKELNKAVKGKANSQHVTGEAVDIDMDGSSGGVTNAMVFNFIKDNLKYDQLLWEYGTSENPDWVHVSFSASGKQRNQTLRIQ
jgi:zinc D-Ala-D-Ala carboxypeptidase